MRTFFELLPVALAIVAIILSGVMYNRARRKADKVRNILSIICAVLLIIAQTSWYTTAVVMNKLEDTWIANVIWTVFNILTMLTIIVNSIPRKPK